MKIGIITGGIDNFGERAIYLGTIIELREKYPQAEIALFGFSNIDQVDGYLGAITHRLKIRLEKDVITGKTKFEKGYKYAALLIWPKHILGEKRYEYLRDCDLVVAKGQETLTSSYGPIHYIDSIFGTYAISRFNPNVELLGHSIGPIQSGWGVKFAKIAVSKLKKIYVRDSRSQVALQKLGYHENKIVLIKDLAYKGVQSMKELEQEEGDGHYLVVPNAALVAKRSDEDKQKYVNLLSAVINILITGNRKVSIGSSVLATDWNSDYAICEQLANEHTEAQLKRFKDLKDFVTDVKRANCVISSRLHPLIMADAINTDIVAITDSPKTIGLLGDAGLENRIISPYKINTRHVQGLLNI
jgi:polysaccharide pyruvyl transferase WcaK-like protein